MTSTFVSFIFYLFIYFFFCISVIYYAPINSNYSVLRLRVIISYLNAVSSFVSSASLPLPASILFFCVHIYIFFFLYQKSTAFIKDDSLGSLGSLPLLSPFHLPLNCNFIYLSFDATSTLLSLNLMPGMKLPPDHADMQISFVFRETGRGLAMQMSYLFREILAITRNAINSSKLIPPPHPTNPSF